MSLKWPEHNGGKGCTLVRENSIYQKAKQAVAAGILEKEKAPLIVAMQKDNEFNIRSPEKFLSFLQQVGYKVPKITKKEL